MRASLSCFPMMSAPQQVFAQNSTRGSGDWKAMTEDAKAECKSCSLLMIVAWCPISRGYGFAARYMYMKSNCSVVDADIADADYDRISGGEDGVERELKSLVRISMIVHSSSIGVPGPRIRTWTLLIVENLTSPWFGPRAVSYGLRRLSLEPRWYLLRLPAHRDRRYARLRRA